MTIPPPNQFDSGTHACSPYEAVAPAPSGDATADIQELLDAIGGDCRFVLDEEAFMAAIEPPPLFLQKAG